MRFVWMDLEMTGLDPERCAIIEIAAIVTGEDLVPIAEIERVVWQPEEVLARMTPFVRDMHTKNGLLARVRSSPTALADAERDVLALLSQHTSLGEGVLAGNSIHQDRRFIARYMPGVDRWLHYRHLDVSSLKVLAKAWFAGKVEFKKDGKDHTALADVRASIEELRYYREHLLRAAAS